MNILVGITGSIAASLAQFYIYNLREELNCEIDVVGTEKAFDFVTPLSLKTFSKGKVYRDNEFDDTAGILHLELGEAYDILLIMPCTANTIAKIANGFCSDLLSTVAATAEMPVLIAPAMNPKMWSRPLIQKTFEPFRTVDIRLSLRKLAQLFQETMA